MVLAADRGKKRCQWLTSHTHGDALGVPRSPRCMESEWWPCEVRDKAFMGQRVRVDVLVEWTAKAL